MRTSTRGSPAGLSSNPRWAGGSRSPRSSSVSPPAARTCRVTLKSFGPPARITPHTVQAWREENEQAGRDLMLSGAWLVHPSSAATADRSALPS
ncbi:hypothetical protein ACFWVB_16170 [Streptomyces microflavus]|uniref:hypothetical protein n=1 Tax=Streptomyces microflavus TaxID=1919 RepID=UPI0036558F2D